MACIGLALSAGDNDTAKDVKEEIAPKVLPVRRPISLLVAKASSLFVEILSTTWMPTKRKWVSKRLLECLLE